MNDIPEDRKTQESGKAAPANGVSSAEAGAQDQANELERLRAENSDLRDKILRSMAELENFRRRAEREKADLSKYAISDFARDAVSIGDNLRRAIESVPRDAAGQDPNLKSLIDGVEVTERELFKVFERHGVKRFDPLGEKFDPHVHEAMVKVDVPNAAADTIVQVLHAGYMIGERVLRPAAVIVAKGSPAVETKPAPAPSEHENVPPQEAHPQAHEAPPQAEAQGGGVAFRQPDADPDIQRKRDGTPRRGGAKREDGPGGEKRTSSMTKPVTENSTPPRKDEFISTFGKRLEN